MLPSGPVNERFAWRSVISAYSEGLPDAEKTQVRAYRVEVEVSWAGLMQTRSVRLETLKLAPVATVEGR
jgi:general secretion pathway protein I